MNKYKEIIASPRFQMLALAAVTHGLSIYKDSKDLFAAITTALIELLTAATIVGTTDKFSQAKLAAATNTTVSIPATTSKVTASTTSRPKRTR